MASTHSAPLVSDLTAALFAVPRHTGEDKAVTDDMKTKPSVTSYGFCFNLGFPLISHSSAIVSISWQNWAGNKFSRATHFFILF